MWETWVRFLAWENPLEEGMATHSSILAWKIPMGRGAWQTVVHGVTKSQTQLSDFHFPVLYTYGNGQYYLRCAYVWAWPKSSFGFFCNSVRKYLNKLFGQCNTNLVSHLIRWFLHSFCHWFYLNLGWISLHTPGYANLLVPLLWHSGNMFLIKSLDKNVLIFSGWYF